MMAAENTSETSVNFYQTTRRTNPEDSNLNKCQYFNPAKEANMYKLIK
jgi:hypothetical protein